MSPKVPQNHRDQNQALDLSLNLPCLKLPHLSSWLLHPPWCLSLKPWCHPHFLFLPHLHPTSLQFFVLFQRFPYLSFFLFPALFILVQPTPSLPRWPPAFHSCFLTVHFLLPWFLAYKICTLHHGQQSCCKVQPLVTSLTSSLTEPPSLTRIQPHRSLPSSPTFYKCSYPKDFTFAILPGALSPRSFPAWPILSSNITS